MDEGKKGLLKIALIFLVFIVVTILFFKAPWFESEYDVSSGDMIPIRTTGNDELLTGYQNSAEAHREIWERFKLFFPEEYRREIKCFIADTDGNSGQLGHFRRSRDDTGWCIGIDMRDAFSGYRLRKRQLDSTLVHEFGHLLTYMSSQYDYYATGRCKYVDSFQGCPLPDSYYAQYYELFWRDRVFTWQQYGEERADEFYRAYPEEFVTPYAATNPIEDFAESWTRFVNLSQPQSYRDGDISARAKIGFFYAFPELRALREHIRAVQ